MKNLKNIIKPHTMKILSVVFAIFVWLYVVNSAQIEMEKEVLINYKIPVGMAISSEVPRHVIYTIKGPRGFVRNIQKRDDTILIDIEKIYQKNKKVYRFDVKNYGLSYPLGVDIVSIDNPYIQIKLEKKISKKVPVKVQTVGAIAENFEITSQHVAPSSIVISGANSVISAINYIPTLPVDLSSLKGSGSREIGFDVKDRRIDLETDTGEYYFEVRSTQSNLLLAKIPITFMTTGLIKSVDRRSVNIMVLARNGKETKIDKKKVKVLANIPSGTVGKVVIELKADLPDEFELVEIRPNTISAVLE